MALNCVAGLDLPDWLIAAGLIRNTLWSHQFDRRTAINDIDVIYFCKNDCSAQRDIELENRLNALQPMFSWSVKNQARMHINNNHRPYFDTLDAMTFWPEKQTSIGIKLNHAGDLLVRHVFDLSYQFNGCIDQNPKAAVDIFQHRVNAKTWLEQWPELTTVLADT